jgi:CRP-like cAMP-binding protein
MRSLLQQVGHCRGLGDAEQAALEASFDDPREYERRAFAWDGDDENCYLVMDGWLARSVVLRDSRRQIVDLLLPGDIIHGVAGVSSQPRELGHVLSLTSACVASLPGDRMRWLYEEFCHVAYALLAAAAHGGERLARHVLRLGRLGAHERTAHLLLDLLMRLDRVGLARDQSYVLPLTQSELADVLGLSPIHLHRVMRALTRDRLIEIRGRAERTSVRVCDLPRLAEIAGFELLTGT